MIWRSVSPDQVSLPKKPWQKTLAGLQGLRWLIQWQCYRFKPPGVISVHHIMRNDGECSQTAQLHYRPLGNQGNLSSTFLPSCISFIFLIITAN